MPPGGGTESHDAESAGVGDVVCQGALGKPPPWGGWIQNVWRLKACFLLVYPVLFSKNEWQFETVSSESCLALWFPDLSFQSQLFFSPSLFQGDPAYLVCCGLLPLQRRLGSWLAGMKSHKMLNPIYKDDVVFIINMGLSWVWLPIFG